VNHEIDARHGHLDDPHDDGGKNRGNDGERSGTDASSGGRAVARDAGIGAAHVTPRSSRGWQPILSGHVTVVEPGDVSQFAMPK
jgi:hypothetical protein